MNRGPLLFCILFYALVGLSGCRPTPAPASSTEAQLPATSNGPVIVKVRVDRQGGITLDGAPATLQEARAAFKRLADAESTVWFYRERPRGETHPNVIAVMTAIMKAGLSMSVSTKADFSNVGGPGGRPSGH